MNLLLFQCRMKPFQQSQLLRHAVLNAHVLVVELDVLLELARREAGAVVRHQRRRSRQSTTHALGVDPSRIQGGTAIADFASMRGPSSQVRSRRFSQRLRIDSALPTFVVARTMNHQYLHHARNLRADTNTTKLQFIKYVPIIATTTGAHIVAMAIAPVRSTFVASGIENRMIAIAIAHRNPRTLPEETIPSESRSISW